MKISVDEARPFFAHPSQLAGAGLASPDELLADGFEYWADGPVCGVFHRAPWPGVWWGHYGVMPEGWGKLTAPAKRILTAFCADVGASCIIGWTKRDNRAAIAFARRLGFRQTGTMDAGRVITSEWRPE